ncbi:MAG: hypothetical protein HY725_00060 [Candidatus Rokubacteria bacterium]|nr:hypothetical protein [Candidatus Rokubacteria bacterium]
MGRGALASLVFLSCLLGSAPLSAASFSLTPRETQEAIRFGQRSVVSEEFGREWKTVNSSGETLTVVTPFFRLAQAARNAAFRAQSLKQREIDALLKEHQRRLLVWAFLKGGGEDFARWYQAVLRVPGKGEIRPSFVQNERTALRQEDGRFLARSIYAFPADDLDPKGRVTLVVRDKDEREVARFVIDLSAMR